MLDLELPVMSLFMDTDLWQRLTLALLMHLAVHILSALAHFALHVCLAYTEHCPCFTLSIALAQVQCAWSSLTVTMIEYR